MRFIGIDNSTMRVTDEQLRFFERAVAPGQGVNAAVLMVHVPLFLPSLLSEGMKDGTMPLKRRDLFAAPPTAEQRGADETTLRFAAAVAQASSLACVLAGHIHDATDHPLSEDSRSV